MKRSWLAGTLLLILLSYIAVEADAAKLDLNKATREQLIGLGLSESQAAQVVSHREKSGAFLQIDELLVVPQMRPETVDAIRDRVTVDE